MHGCTQLKVFFKKKETRSTRSKSKWHLPHSIVIRLGESNVMDNLILLGMSRTQAAREDGGRAALMKVTTGSQGLVVRTHCVIKRWGRGGAGGRKGATYKKRQLQLALITTTRQPRMNGRQGWNDGDRERVAE